MNGLLCVEIGPRQDFEQRRPSSYISASQISEPFIISETKYCFTSSCLPINNCYKYLKVTEDVSFFPPTFCLLPLKTSTQLKVESIVRDTYDNGRCHNLSHNHGFVSHHLPVCRCTVASWIDWLWKERRRPYEEESHRYGKSIVKNREPLLWW